jgi:hypothetical protein
MIVESSVSSFGKNRVLQALFFLFCVGIGFLTAWPLSASGSTPALADIPLYASYGAILQAYVDKRGMVDYKRLRADKNLLDGFVAGLGNGKYVETMPEEEKIAFWINTYNALTLKAVIDHYPIRASALRSVLYPGNSIRQIPGVWDKLRFPVAGMELTLDDIEHSILRMNFDEPRIHLALVCAARGCPPLRNEPYDAARLDAQLDDQARRFFADSTKFRLDRKKGTVFLSPIFKWYGQDFVKRYGTTAKFPGKMKAERAVLNFASKYLDSDGRSFLESRNPSIHYPDYDWSLNDNE